mgnify:FL=1
MQRQRQILKQKLNLSPLQIQFLNLLQIPIVDLDKRIEKEIEENPVIEEDDLEESENEKVYLSTNNQSNDRKTDFLVDNFTGNINTLSNHLQNQLIGSEKNEDELKVVKYLINSLDENGFLRRESTSIINDYYIINEIEISEDLLNDALKTLKDLEPAGVGAKNLRECLIIQNNKSDFDNKLLIKNILENYYEAFTNKNFEKIIRELNIEKEQLSLVYNNVESLNPIPGAGFSKNKDNTEYIIPDFSISSKDGNIDIKLNKVRRRKINVSSYYQKILDETSDEKTKDFLKQKLEQAKWFIESLEKRNETLLKVMSAIAEIQKAYFISGEDKDLKPMKLADISEKVQLDISTISRVTNSKYLEASFGTFLLKELFSEAYRKDSGEIISTKEIKNKLIEIIESENKEHPFTDENLCKLLGEDDYNIARRTVAKYRDELKIPTARNRRSL